MSYWCGFEDGPDSINMTSNVAPMWRLAGADLAIMDGKSAIEVRSLLIHAICQMLTYPDQFKALNPVNGWGDYKGCVKYLTELAVMCTEVNPSELFYAHH